MSFENPLTVEIITSVFKEANKQSSDAAYRTSSLRCLTDLVHFSTSEFKDSFFEDYWSQFVLKYFESDVAALWARETRHAETLRARFEDEKENGDEKKKDERVEASKEDGDEDKEAGLVNSSMKLIVLETLGKCWPYSTEIQGCFIFITSFNKFTCISYFFYYI